MGQYSYSQPSSSEEYDIDLTSLLQAEADIYADEAESRQNIVESVEYVPQPEADDGIPKTCYCGGEPVVATAYRRKDQGRRYFTCENADDGDCHIWKWWDVAVMEEFGDYQRQLRELKAQADESEEKLVKVEKTVGELAKRKTGITNGYPLVVCVMVSLIFVICVLVTFKWVSFFPYAYFELFHFFKKLLTLLSHVCSGRASEDDNVTLCTLEGIVETSSNSVFFEKLKRRIVVFYSILVLCCVL